MPLPGQAQRAESKFIVFENFEKMNTQSVRQALKENELAWLENLQPIAGNNLTTVPSPNSALVSIAETFISLFFANLGTVDYIIGFTTVGGGWAINIATGVATQFAVDGTFTNPDMTVWQSQYVLINDMKSSYAVWNGTIFVREGGVSPNIELTNGGSNYTSVPTVALSGGSGSGATAVATIGTPAVIAVNVVNGGSQYASAPTVVFSGGGGTGAAATANIDPRSVKTFTLTSGGNYFNPAAPFPNITFSGGGGTGAAANVVSMGPGPGGTNVVNGIVITSFGSGYSSAPTIAFVGGFVTTPATATCTVGNGAVTSITVTSGGGGYTSAPTVSFTGGGGGTGVSAIAVVGGSGVTSVTLTNPGGGYLASDVLTVTISGGGGTGATAVAHVFPFVPAGTTLAVFGGRVWLGGGRLLQFTGTQGFDDFNSANASGSLTISDADLTHAITALRNYNNYLFIMGDQSVKQIGNISLDSTGTVTLFTILTLSSDQGTIYPRSCISYNRLFLFANTNGVYAVFGSAVQKISDDMDGIFKLVDFTQSPNAAIVDLNNIHNVAYLVRYIDPVAGERSIMITWTGKKWFVLSQGNSIAAITTASTLASGKNFTYATSGRDITQMFGAATVPISWTLTTALTHHANPVQRKKLLAAGTAVTATGTGTMTVSFDTENGSVVLPYSLVNGFQLPSGNSGVGGSGRYIGLTITGTLAGFTFTSAAAEFQETSVWK